MNKKRLSVVMAGAMLASSVAPVLAADAEVSKVEIEKGALITDLTEKIWAAPVFSDDAKRVDSDLVGKSVLGIQIDKEPVKTFEEANKSTGSESKLQAAIKKEVEGLKVGQEVKLVNLGYEEIDGKDAEGNAIKLIVSKKALSSKYTDTELKYVIDKELAELKVHMGETNYNNLIDDDNTDSAKDKTKYANGKYTITLKSTAVKDNKIELTTNSDKLNFMQYIKKASTTNVADEIVNIPKHDAGTTITNSDFKGFALAEAEYGDIENKDEAIYTIVSGIDTFKLSDLYDGLYLTTEGQKILDEAKEAYLAKTDINTVVVRNYSDDARLDSTKKVGEKVKEASLTDTNGNYTIKIEITKDGKTNAYNVTATNRAQLARFAKWIDAAKAEVEVIAGEDRYATAVKLAKEVALTELLDADGTANTAKEKHIVLVNGNSLVDGLAAAPLAQHFAKDGAGKGNAPILLTKTNELPKVTKRYLRELIDTAKNDTITVHIVGGEAVVSNNVRKELRELGLNVDRFGGENREETSMAVANEIGFDNGAFVVGAEGEADAMSISGYAASKVMPVVVSSYKGLSEDTVDALDGSNVNIIGGEAKISKAEEEEISAVADSVKRIAGENRKATNAEVISTFYKKSFASTKSVIVAKDDELVDALTASNLSVVDNAPIVLGTNSLSDAQKKAIAYNAGKAGKIYQMSTNVAREVTKAVAQALKLS